MYYNQIEITITFKKITSLPIFYILEKTVAQIKATIFLDKTYWVGIFERIDKKGYAAARHIFGSEPANPEIYEFILNHYGKLNFGKFTEFTLQIKRKNPKRVQKEVRKEMEKIKQTSKPSTFSQDYMREALEKNKLEKKQLSKAEKELRKQEQFAIKQEKKKHKHKGH